MQYTVISIRKTPHTLSTVYAPVYLVPINIDFVFIKCVDLSIVFCLFTAVDPVLYQRFTIPLWKLFFFFFNKQKSTNNILNYESHIRS